MFVGAGGRGVDVLVGGPSVGVGGWVAVGGTGGVVGTGVDVGSVVLVGLGCTSGVDVKVGTKVLVGVGVADCWPSNPPKLHPKSTTVTSGQAKKAKRFLLIRVVSLPYSMHYTRVPPRMQIRA